MHCAKDICNPVGKKKWQINVFKCNCEQYLLKVLVGMSELGVKVKAKAKFTLEKATKGQRGSKGIALLFL